MENETPPDISTIDPYRAIFDSEPERAFIAIRNHIGGAMWPSMRFLLSHQPCPVCFFSMLRGWAITEEGYARAAYNQFFGAGQWEELYLTALAEHKKAAFDKGFSAGKAVLGSLEGVGIVSYEGDFPEEYQAGLEAAAQQYNTGRMQ